MRGMFTRSQQWRRVIRKPESSEANRPDIFQIQAQRAQSTRVEPAPELRTAFLAKPVLKSSIRNISMPSVCSSEVSTSSIAPPMSPPWVLEQASQVLKKVSKRVGFSNVDRIVLIPTRQEYIAHNLRDKMWWTDADYTDFKRTAIREYAQIKQETQRSLSETSSPTTELRRELNAIPANLDFPPPPPLKAASPKTQTFMQPQGDPLALAYFVC
jgi:hypothetical protein